MEKPAQWTSSCKTGEPLTYPVASSLTMAQQREPAQTGPDIDPIRQLSIAPGDSRHVADIGVVHHPQDEGGGGNVSHYEIGDPTDEIDFTVVDEVNDFTNPVLKIYQLWGSTEFAVFDRDTNEQIVADISGFGENVWRVDISSTSGKLRITDFTTNTTKDGTEAAVVDYVEVVGSTT